MNFTMKILAVSVLLVAMMALALGTEAPPEAEAAPGTEGPVLENEKEDFGISEEDEETESEDEDEEEAESTEEEKKHEVAKRYFNFEYFRKKRPQRHRWYRSGGLNYRYFSYARTWAQAQKHCKSLGGNLASVHNNILNTRMRAWAQHKPAWIGFSDCQQEGSWFWIDGTRFNYNNWCSGEPNNFKGNQHCAVINWTGLKCWDDAHCTDRRPYICAWRH